MEKILDVKCRCGGKLKATQAPAKFFGIDFGIYPAEVCLKCGEVFFEQKVMMEIEKEVKKRGLFGLQVESTMKKRNGKLIIDTPNKFYDFLGKNKNILIIMYPIDKNRFEIEIRNS